MLILLNQQSLLVLFRLLAAHAIADALFGSQLWKDKIAPIEKKSNWQWVKGITAAILTFFIIFSWSSWYWLPIAIFLSRVLLTRYTSKQEGVKYFVIHLGSHTIVILLCWLFLVTDSIAEFIHILCAVQENTWLWTVLLSYTLVIWPAGIWTGKLTEPWRKELMNDQNDTRYKGLTKAGMWIGRLERILILTFIFLNHFEAIGFLIAAKSVFRFEEIKSSNDRKETEYILIGTMISFLMAIFFGILAMWILNHVA